MREFFKSFAILALVGSTLMGCANTNIVRSEAHGPVELALATTVAVSDELGHGSGVVIDANTVLTARHVVEGTPIGGKVTVQYSNGDQREATVAFTGVDSGDDLAVLHTDTTGHSVAPMSCAKPYIGQEVMVFGYPKFLANIATYGFVAGFNTNDELEAMEASAVVLDVKVNPGNSGGPVFDMSGRVIGIANAMIPNTGLGIMLPNTVICKALGR